MSKKVLNYITLPVVSDGEGDIISDSEGREIMNVRGWGDLQYFGYKESVKIQIEIGDMFAKAFNQKYSV